MAQSSRHPQGHGRSRVLGQGGNPQPGPRRSRCAEEGQGHAGGPAGFAVALA